MKLTTTNTELNIMAFLLNGLEKFFQSYEDTCRELNHIREENPTMASSGFFYSLF